MENYEDYLKKVADLGGVDQNASNNFLETFLRIEYGEGYTYEGDLQNNLPHGQGVLKSDDGFFIRQGVFKKGKLNGKGECFLDGEKYSEGIFKDNILHGFGCTYLGGKKWREGEFKDGKLNGYGTSFLNEKIYEQGDFLNDKLHGFGSKFSSCDEIGEFKNGELHGQGKRYFLGGRIIKEGLFINGEFQEK